MYVAKFDVDGNQLWFQEFLANGNNVLTAGNGLGALALVNGGDLVVGLNDRTCGCGTTETYLFKLNAANGKLR